MKLGNLIETKNGLPANASWYRSKFPFAALKNDNRRFMYNPKTNEIVIGKLDPLSGKGVDSSHEKEFKASGAPGGRQDFPLSGWIGIGGNYPHGVIHFAPPMVTSSGNEEVIEAGKRIIDLFKASGATSNTVLRNFMKMGEQRLGVVSETFIQNRLKMVITESLLTPTPETIKMFTAFLKKKWAERSEERYGHRRSHQPPKDLQGACKFSSLFAQQLFGGELRGNWHHQFLVLPNGKTIDPVPVPEVDDPQYHDEEFWMNPDHRDSLESCMPRVKEWVKEFMSLNESTLMELKKGIDKGSQKREKIGFATDDPDKYVGKWEAYDEPQGINSKAGKKQVKAESIVGEGNSMGPEFSRGGNNSSTGSGAVPVIVQPPDLPRSLRSKKKYTGSKSPISKVRQNVRKSTKNKVRKANSSVTEVFDDPKNAFPYSKDGSGWYEVDAGIEGLQIMVGMEDIRNYNPQLPPGENVGMVTMDDGGVNLGVEPAKLGMTSTDTIRLFNSMMNIVREYVNENDPDRMYFIAVKPMEGIYQRLISRFVDPNEWKITIINNVPIPMIGSSLNAYMIEKKSKLSEMARLPMNKTMNNDYEVKDGEDIVGKAEVTDGVIEMFMVNVSEEHPSDFRGHVMSSLMGTIVRDADGINANMSMQIENPDDMEMKRFLERFGFRHVGQGIFRRTAGASTPPSVIY